MFKDPYLRLVFARAEAERPDGAADFAVPQPKPRPSLSGSAAEQPRQLETVNA
jgi:hypothetical protein